MKPSPSKEEPPVESRYRLRLHEIIFEADTPAGVAFDAVLLVCIAFSVAVVMLASVDQVRAEHGAALYRAEWFFTALFTVEYALRLYSVKRPLSYATSFFGVVDLLSIVPTYIGFFFAGAESLLVIRMLRMIRIFRVFKLAPYLIEGRVLMLALRRSQRKVTVFLTTVLSAVVVMGALMFVVEGPETGFTSIPVSMYWAVVTITTVGYGDISPQTPLGQLLASVIMVFGYAIIAVPTGIVTVELAEAARKPLSTQSCRTCGAAEHDLDARFCKICGEPLNARSEADDQAR